MNECVVSWCPQLELEITRYDSLLNTFTLPPTINSSLFSKYCAKARLDEFNLCRTLGFDPNLWKLCCIHAIPELCNMDFLWSKPDLTPDKIYVVSDGSEKDGIGGMATIIADPVLKKVFAFACQVSPGPGNVTSYRAETYGFWVAAAGPFLLRRHLSSLPIVHWADNQGAIINQQHLDFRPCVVSGDIWDEHKHYVASSTEHFGNYSVEWTKAHPEKMHSSVLEYSGIEILHFCADALANRARCGFAVSDPICDCTIPRHPSSPFIVYKGCRIFDGPYVNFLVVLRD
mmetsp:Transcript_4425/g.6700  ORF Transcript_4425/g.6700 Transcript_4425/m.6700 type:complete len:287 (+) Transcript_4425:64-924(+)